MDDAERRVAVANGSPGVASSIDLEVYDRRRETMLQSLTERGLLTDALAASLKAAETSGDPRLVPAARELAAALRRGERLDRGLPGRGEFPPLLLWLMTTSEHHAALLPALKHAAETYHRRARHQADLTRVFLPILLTLALGGSVALLYVLAALFALGGLMVTMVRIRYGLVLVLFVGAIMAFVTISFQLHRMGPTDRLTDKTIRQLPKSKPVDDREVPEEQASEVPST